MPAKGKGAFSDIQWILFSPQAMEATLEGLCRLADFFREHGSGLKQVAQNFTTSVKDAAERRGDDEAFDHDDDVGNWQEHLHRLEVEMGKLRDLCDQDSTKSIRYTKLLDTVSSAVERLQVAVTINQELTTSRHSEVLRASEGQALDRVADHMQGEKHFRMSDIFAQFADEVTSMLTGTENIDDNTHADPVGDGQRRPDSSTLPASEQGEYYEGSTGSPQFRNFSVPAYSPRAYSDRNRWGC